MADQNNSISLEPYRGTRDLYPEDLAIQKYIFKTFRSAVEQFGYVEYDAPILESTDLYRAKSSEEIVNEQTYSFTDRGGRDVTIRPEMTPSIARMIARKRKELPVPLRWYSAPNVMRYERPQRGRLREHRQFNVDIFGLDQETGDLEILEVATGMLRALGTSDDMFTVLVSDRRLINAILQDVMGVSGETATAVVRLTDRMKKMSEEEFKGGMTELLGDKTDVFIAYLHETDLSVLKNTYPNIEIITELEALLVSAIEVGLPVKYDPTLMRGFDYYTGMVFEVADTDPANNRSLFGGGRYDNLIGQLGVEPLSAVGFGVGDVVIADVLETHNLIPENLLVASDVYLCVLDTSLNVQAQTIARKLRKSGVRVLVDSSGRKIGQQFRTAEKQGVTKTLIIGADEIEKNVVTLKDLTTGEQSAISLNELIKVLGD